MQISSLMRTKMMIKVMTTRLASLSDTFKRLVSHDLGNSLVEFAPISQVRVSWPRGK